MIANEEYMELKVLRKHKLSLRAISAQTGMAVNTVRKYLAGGPPVMKKLDARKSKLDPFKDYLADRIQAPNGGQAGPQFGSSVALASE